MTRVLRDARLASRLVTRSGRLLQGEPVPPSSRSSSSLASTSSGGPPKRCATAAMLGLDRVKRGWRLSSGSCEGRSLIISLPP